MAQNNEGRESVVYWSRIGEYLPASSPQQRIDHLRISMEGIIADGLLSRFSTSGSDPSNAWKALQDFIPALVSAVAPSWRKVLIGTDRAASLAALRSTPAG
jgi:hypothetical protein